MPNPFRFAIQSLRFAEPGSAAEAARQAEALGYDEIYSYDHFGAVDPFVPLMAAAAVTTTLRVGPLVLNNEFHHPALLARTAATLDRFTGGRLVLGFGTGYMQSEHDAIGLTLRPPPERVDRFEESLAAIRDLLDTGRCVMDGEHHRLAVEDLGVRPIQARVPFLIGGHGRRVVALAARHADIFQFTGLTHGPGGTPRPGGFAIDEVRVRARWLDEAGPSLAGGFLERSILVQHTTVVGSGDGLAAGASHDGAAAEREATERLADRFALDTETLDSTPFVLIGSVERIVDKLERLRAEIGVSHVVVRDAEGFAPVVAALAGR